MGLFTKKTLADYMPRVSTSDVRKRARILVIDDDQSAFPVELLRSEGYIIDYWESVRNFSDLESGLFDIIVLDIHGIATPEQSSTGGIGILEHIKRYNPAQVVIAYSAKKYDFNQAAFWKLADDFLGKPSSLVVCKQKIDELILAKLTPLYYWEKLKELLHKEDVPDSEVAKIEKALLKRLKSSRQLSKEELAAMIKLTQESLSAAATILTIIFRWFSDG